MELIISSGRFVRAHVERTLSTIDRTNILLLQVFVAWPRLRLLENVLTSIKRMHAFTAIVR